MLLSQRLVSCRPLAATAFRQVDSLAQGSWRDSLGTDVARWQHGLSAPGCAECAIKLTRTHIDVRRRVDVGMPADMANCISRTGVCATPYNDVANLSIVNQIGLLCSRIIATFGKDPQRGVVLHYKHSGEGLVHVAQLTQWLELQAS